MTIVHRLLASIIAVVLVAGVIATFTVDDDSDPDNVASRATTSTVDTLATDDDDEPQVDDGAQGDDGAADEDPGEDTTTTTAETTTTTTEAPTTTQPTATTLPPLGVTATAAGSYTYDVTGCCDENGNNFAGTSVLTVPDPDADGRQVQVEEPQDSGRDGASETTYRFTPEGTYLEAIQMAADGMTFRLEATRPFLLIPAASAPGTVTRGHLQYRGRMSTPFGNVNVVINADVTFRLMEVTDQTSTAVLEVDISGSAGPCSIAGEMNSTIVARTLDQLPIDTRSESVTNITGPFCPGRMTSNTHSVLRQ